MIRSFLFTPANAPRRIEKALTLDADALILDLEDSVAPSDKASCRKAVIEALVRGLPMLERMIPGYASAEGVITAPETRASSPLRIVRDDVTRESTTVGGLYPVGEGAGYAGGIVSSATDGMKSAEELVRRFAPLR